jgi:pimeloyl-ACP methyl ester carboxylesterase
MNLRRFVFLTIALALALAAAQDVPPFRDPSPHRTQFVTVASDVRLEVLDWGGTGRPLVFLAGYLTAHAFDDIAPKLTANAHVYGITRRGLGASSRPPTGYTARESAEDVLHVLDALKLEKPILAGHSFGGQDLTVLGASYPDRMAGLVYLDSAEDTSLGPMTTAAGQPDPSWLPADLRGEAQPDLSSVEAFRETQRRRLGMALPEAEVRLLYEIRPNGTLGQYLVSKQVRDALFHGLQPADYARIRVPVLALFALPAPLEEQLKRYRPENAEQGAAMGFRFGIALAEIARNENALRRGVPGARVVEVSGARTYIFLSNEADVLRELGAFIAQLR